MMKCFSKLGLCFRPRRSPPLGTDNSYLIPIHPSGDYALLRGERASRYPHLQSRWRPELSAIVEVSEVQDYDNDVDGKSEKKSSGKSRSTADIAERRDKGDSMPVLFVSLFWSSPFMF